MASTPNTGSVAEMLRTGRAKSGYTVRGLAPLIRKPHGGTIVPSYITDLEKGRAIPSDFVAQELIRVLEMPPYFLDECRKARAGGIT